MIKEASEDGNMHTHACSHTHTKTNAKKEGKSKLRDQVNVYGEFSTIAEAAPSNPTWK